MKKIALIALLVALVATPVFAFEFKGVGIEASANVGIGPLVTTRFGLGDKGDLTFGAGYGFETDSINVKVGYCYDVLDFELFKFPAYLAVGGQATFAVSFRRNSYDYYMTPDAYVTLVADFGPVSAYAKVGPGIWLEYGWEGVGFNMELALGIEYNL